MSLHKVVIEKRVTGSSLERGEALSWVSPQGDSAGPCGVPTAVGVS